MGLHHANKHELHGQTGFRDRHHSGQIPRRTHDRQQEQISSDGQHWGTTINIIILIIIIFLIVAISEHSRGT
jgi:Ca2+/H+ antiporter